VFEGEDMDGLDEMFLVVRVDRMEARLKRLETLWLLSNPQGPDPVREPNALHHFLRLRQELVDELNLSRVDPNQGNLLESSP
jgi:hypothetical protein